MAARLTRTSDSVPDELSGLRELVRLLARQAAREAVISASAERPSNHPNSRQQPSEEIS